MGNELKNNEAKENLFIKYRTVLLRIALSNPTWMSHKIGDQYTMDNKPDLWSIAYYPIFEDGKTGEKYSEPRSLIERPAVFNGEPGTDFREVPLRYLSKQ